MFYKTKKRIYGNIMLIAAVLIILMIAPSILMFSDMLYNTYESMAKNRLDRSLSSGRFFIDSVMTTTENIALNPQVGDMLSGTKTSSLTSILDSACTYSLYINAITVYGTDGKIYTSSQAMNPPAIAELKNIQGIAEFIDDTDAVEYVSLRNSGIIKAYEGTPYDERSGIISCCRKIYGADGNVTGYVFSDIFPKTIFEYFDYSGDVRLKNCVAMISFDGGYFTSDPTKASENFLNAYPGTRTDNHLIIAGTRNFYGGAIRIAVPLTPLHGDIAVISSAVIICGLCLLTAAHFAAAAIARSFTKRLQCLFDKMSASQEKFTAV